MALARLLKVGKALSEGREWPGRYRMPRKGALPSFGCRPIPTSNAAAFAGEPADPAQQELSWESPTAETPRNPVVAQPTLPPASPGEARCSVTPSRIKLKSLTATAAKTMGWFRGVTECAVWLVRLPFRRRPEAPRQARQADLPRLDAVRVVRNDLSDSDFQIVTTPKAGSVKAANPFKTDSTSPERRLKPMAQRP